MAVIRAGTGLPRLVKALNIIQLASIEKNGETVDFSERAIPLFIGDETVMTIQVKSPEGDLLPLTASFKLPIAGIYGTPAKIATVDFVDGTANVSMVWDVEGMYEVTEKQVNHNIPDPANQFRFEKLEFKVEKPAV